MPGVGAFPSPHLSSLAVHLRLYDKHGLSGQGDVTSGVGLELDYRVGACCYQYAMCMCTVCVNRICAKVCMHAHVHVNVCVKEAVNISAFMSW